MFGIALAFPVSLLVLIATVIGVCPGASPRSVVAIAPVGFVVYGLVLVASVTSFERWGREEEDLHRERSSDTSGNP